MDRVVSAGVGVVSAGVVVVVVSPGVVVVVVVVVVVSAGVVVVPAGVVMLSAGVVLVSAVVVVVRARVVMLSARVAVSAGVVSKRVVSIGSTKPGSIRIGDGNTRGGMGKGGLIGTSATNFWRPDALLWRLDTRPFTIAS